MMVLLNLSFHNSSCLISSLLDPMSEALLGLRLRRAIVVHGAGGLDEASLQGVNEMRLVEDGKIKTSSLNPSDFGLTLAPIEALRVGDLDTNKKIIENVLKGGGTNAQRDVVALNTALALWSGGEQNDLSLALDQSLRCLDQGLPWQKLIDLKIQH